MNMPTTSMEGGHRVSNGMVMIAKTALTRLLFPSSYAKFFLVSPCGFTWNYYFSFHQCVAHISKVWFAIHMACRVGHH